MDKQPLKEDVVLKNRLPDINFILSVIKQLLISKGKTYGNKKPYRYYLAGSEVKAYRKLHDIERYRKTGKPLSRDTLIDSIAYDILLLTNEEV